MMPLDYLSLLSSIALHLFLPAKSLFESSVDTLNVMSAKLFPIIQHFFIFALSSITFINETEPLSHRTIILCPFYLCDDQIKPISWSSITLCVCVCVCVCVCMCMSFINAVTSILEIWAYNFLNHAAETVTCVTSFFIIHFSPYKHFMSFNFVKYKINANTF